MMNSRQSHALLPLVLVLVGSVGSYGQKPTEPPMHVEGLNSRGKQFLLSFGPQLLNSKLSGTNRVYVSSFQATEVRLRMLTEPEKKYRVDPGKMTVIDLPAKVRADSNLQSEGKKEQKGILLTSNAPVSVYALQMKDKGKDTDRASEGYLGLPTALLGTSYVVPGILPTFTSFIQVVARHAATYVSFHLKMWDANGLPDLRSLKYGNISYKSGDNLRVQLGELESFVLSSYYDFTGTTVTSDKPVSVISGCDCTQDPPCNHLVEAIPPVSHLGKSFIAYPVKSGNADTFYRVIAARNQTSVSVRGSHAAWLEQGKHHEVKDVKSPVEITTSQPSLVVQYTSRAPTMTVIPPRFQWSNDYMMEAPRALTGHYFNASLYVVIDTKHRDGLRVRYESVLMGRFTWTDVVTAAMSTTIVRLQGRFYHVFHTDPLVKFMAVLYGEAASEIESFGFPLGIAVVTRIAGDCSKTVPTPGDGVDNDCDGRVDEEIFNGIDDDRDGTVDEDLAVPKPDVRFPANTTVSLCDTDPSSTSSTGQPSGTGVHQCKYRGGLNITYSDVIHQPKSSCFHTIKRRWAVEDACGNIVKKNQYIRVSTPFLPNFTVPSDVTLTCRDKPFLGSDHTGYLKTRSEICKGLVTDLVDSYTGWCDKEEAKLQRTWTIKLECKKKIVRQTITLLSLSSIRVLKNYVVKFTLNREVFDPKLENPESSKFKTLATRITTFLNESIFKTKSGEKFVGVNVLKFRNGSVEAQVRLKFDNSSSISTTGVRNMTNELQQQVVEGSLSISNVQVEDYDECLKSEDNACDRNAQCSNIPDSYLCTCHEGFVGDGLLCQAPPKVTVLTRLKEVALGKNTTLRCQASGVPPPTFSWTTPEGTEIAPNSPVNFPDAMDDSGATLRRGQAVQEDGSLLVYGTTDKDAGLYECVAKNDLGSDVGTVNVTIRADFVQVDVSLTLADETFTEELEDSTSAEYKALEKTVKDELTIQFQNLTGFERVEILGFSNGSVKVEFRVVIKVDEKKKNQKDQAKKVANTLKEKVKLGFVGKLKVKQLEFREIAPPPKDVNYSDLKEDAARIAWSLPDLSEMYRISGYALQYRMFGVQEWQGFATVRGTSRRMTGLEPGQAYVVRLKTNNPYGISEPSQHIEFKTPKGGSSTNLVLAIVLPIILLAILAVVGLFVYKKLRKRTKHGYRTAEPDSPHIEMPEIGSTRHDRYALMNGPGEGAAAATPMVPSSFTGRHIERDRIKMGKVLGEGEFGMVTRAELTEDDGQAVPCAVKTLKRNATESDFKDLLNELEIMQAAGKHRNIVSLIGACVNDGPLMVVVELATNGPLLRYLRGHRTQNYDDMNEYTLDIPLKQRLDIAIGVADGMSHLGKMKCVHRDLAARNVLLDEEMVAKVSDFGLSRDIYTENVYQKQTGGKLPAKWMAVESLECGTYTSQSDVWSFGVLLWEIETGGCAPYAGLNVRTLLDELKNGHRLDKPRYCSNELYSVMRLCWNANPSQRPTFAQLGEELSQLSNSEPDYVFADPDGKQPLYANLKV